jgi:hypothetical protein
MFNIIKKFFYKEENPFINNQEVVEYRPPELKKYDHSNGLATGNCAYSGVWIGRSGIKLASRGVSKDKDVIDI